MPLFEQLCAQLLEVIYLAVEDKHQGLILIKHRLTALCKVDNTEPSEAERNIGIHKLTRRVRPSVYDSVHHTPEHRAVILYIIGKAGKATH